MILAIDQIHTIALIASAIISISMAVAAILHQRTLGVYAFVCLKTAIGLWAFSSLFEVCSEHLETKVFFYSLKYAFIVLVPITWYIFSLYYSNRIRKLERQYIWLFLIPIITITLVATNRYHQLMFTSLNVFENGSIFYVAREFGTWFWIHATYSYILLLIGFFFMAKHLIDSPVYYKWQVITLLVGGLTPWVANILFTFKLTSYPYLDLTPFAFSLSGVAFMIGILRFQLLDVSPIAQQKVIENIEDVIIVVDGKQRVLNLNPAADELATCDRLKRIGSKAQDVFSWWTKLNIGCTDATPDALSVIEIETKNQQCLMRPRIRPLFRHDRDLALLVTLQDVTEEHKLQSQLFQSQKMEAIGTLAGGIAHDFNNLLMGMQANLSLMQLNAKRQPDLHEKIKRIEAQIQSGADLTRQLLGYARKGKYVVTNVDLGKLITETLTVVQRTNKAITIQPLLSEDPIILKADRGQLEMVLLNLLVNAMDAMPKGGRLTVSTRHITDTKINGNSDQHTQYCELLVADTGTGMDPETQKRIFEPFFTTKDVGRGTGLGLASVYGVIQNHGGYIEVESEEGEGTTFTLHLPTIREPVQEDVCTNAPPNVSIGNGNILLVEDEPLILKYSLEMIQSLGFSAIPTQSGEEAVDIYEKHHRDINLVVLDMVMPGMDGLAVFNAFTRINPQVRVVVTSGFACDARIDKILSQGCHTSLRKPYTREELADKITTVLATRSDGTANDEAIVA